MSKKLKGKAKAKARAKARPNGAKPSLPAEWRDWLTANGHDLSRGAIVNPVREQIAYHEAGHAAVALALGRELSHVTIKRLGSSLGYSEGVRTVDPKDVQDGKLVNTNIIIEHYLDSATVAFAGPLAETVWLEKRGCPAGLVKAFISQSDPSDIADAEEAIRCLGVDAKKAAEAFVVCRKRATEILGDSGPMTEALVRALLEHERLDNVELTEAGLKFAVQQESV